MIFVDGLRRGLAPWRGGRFCHLISDQSLDELNAFAVGLGIPPWWFQAFSFPHFDLSSKWRKKAIGAGAVDCDGIHGGLREFVAAMRRFRANNPDLFRRDRDRCCT